MRRLLLLLCLMLFAGCAALPAERAGPAPPQQHLAEAAAVQVSVAGVGAASALSAADRVAPKAVAGHAAESVSGVTSPRSGTASKQPGEHATSVDVAIAASTSMAGSARSSPSGCRAEACPALSAADAGAAQASALEYVRALQAQRWPAMWELSDSTARQRWPDEAAFAAFLTAKFAPGGRSTIAAVSLGDPVLVPGWNDLRFTPKPVDAVRLESQVTLDPTGAYAMPPGSLVVRSALVLVRDGTAWKVADAGPAGPLGPVLVPALPAPRRLRVPIMMYHHVAPAPQRTPRMSDYDYRLAMDLTVTPEHFSEQLDWLLAHDFHTISVAQLMAAMYDAAPLPRHPIVLTFDDGYLDNAQYAAPALIQRHLTATFNIITGFVGATHGPLQYMSWDQIAGLAAAGMEIGSHTIDHRDLGILSEQDVRGELDGSRDAITQHLGVAPQVLCYPSGEPFRSRTPAAQQRILRVAPQSGYVAGLLDPKVAGAEETSAAPYQLPRIRVPGAAPLSQVAASIQNLAGS